MIKLDDNLLQELGLGTLPPEEKKRMLAHIYETLEMRVGMELAKQMSDAQLNEFEEFINRNDEAGALRWLETNFPNYKDVVAAEFEKLKAEIKQVAPQILASSQQQAASLAQQSQGPASYDRPVPEPGYQTPQQPVTGQPQQYPGVPVQSYQNQPYQQPHPQQYQQQAPQSQPTYQNQPTYSPQQPQPGVWPGGHQGQQFQPPVTPGQSPYQQPQAGQPKQNDYDLAG